MKGVCKLLLHENVETMRVPRKPELKSRKASRKVGWLCDVRNLRVHLIKKKLFKVFANHWEAASNFACEAETPPNIHKIYIKKSQY